MSGPRGATRWLGLGAVVVLIAGLGLAMSQWRRPPAPTSPSPPGAMSTDTSSDRVIDRALEPGDVHEKSRWIADIPGIDIADLDSVRRVIFVRHANTRSCDCGCGYTLAACRVYDSSCPESGPEVAALLDSVRSGAITDARGQREK